ncbi:DUF3392 domain-containing protein [Aliidiomarina soli]|uniref:DUF3392 domain-containing protein n=1 Tax=Aliidiomarina soli TaxID=1928574 RepID=A0A432WMC5_9GAMM|nr:DUF3392 domain-containing protein [Aliidiomarina soli]RUO34914.1 DUF3392 domain-containing protein [Aliidiomarina soli]
MFESWIVQASQWVRPHLMAVSLMVVATLLVLYGNNINAAVRRQIHHYHFVLRTTLFILLCAFGYGLLTSLLTPFLARQLAQLPNYYLAPVVLIVTITLGVLAERKGQA